MELFYAVLGFVAICWILVTRMIADDNDSLRRRVMELERREGGKP